MGSETASSPPQQLEGDALKEAVRKQIEYYFSKTNMASDAYLLSMMDSEYYVNISVIAAFGKIKALNADDKVIVEAVKASDQVVLDETGTKVRPHMQKRSTLILRDIPKETPVEEVEALFKGNKKPATVRPDILNTWFVTFDSEEDTVAALEFLRAGAKFQGKPVRCALKSETIIKSLTYLDPRTFVDPTAYSGGAGGYGAGRQQYVRKDGGAGGNAGGNAGGEGRARRGGPGGGAAGGNRRQGGGGQQHGGQQQGAAGGRANNAAGSSGNTADAGAANAAGTSPSSGAANASGASPASTNGNNNNGAANNNNNGAAQAGQGTGGRGKRKSNRARKDAPAGAAAEKAAPAPPVQVVLTSAHFPPLPSNYSKGFKKYTREQLLDIIRSTEPAKLETLSDGTCVVVLPTPDLRLEAERVDSGEHDRRTSMDFDLTHVAKHQQSHSGVPAGVVEEEKEESHAPSTTASSSEQHNTPTPTSSSPSKVSYAAMLSKKGNKA